MLRNRSGQFIYFSLIATQSGTAVTGGSGAISGRKSLDGLSGMIVLSGNIIELGGGSYRANLYDADTNGDQAGYLFTASGCVPVQYQFDMIDGNGSGRVYLASGSAVSVNSGQLSGQRVNANVTLWNGSPVVAPPVSGVPVVDTQYNSGAAVYPYDFTLDSGSATTITLPAALVDSTSISGVNQYEFMAYSVVGGTGKGQIVLTTSGGANPRQYNVLSGTMIRACDNTSQLVFLHKWQYVSGAPVAASLLSGQSVIVYSGQLSGQPFTATANSGLFVVASVLSGNLSGQQVNLLSGNTIAVLSGTSVNLFSGASVKIYSGQLSGHQVNLLSGNVVEVLSGTNVNLFSGLNVRVYSGQLSGLFVTASLNSGQSVLVYSGQLSGQPISASAASGLFVNASLNSGQSVLVYSGQLSGQPIAATATSGLFVNASLNSGQSVLVYSGQLSGQRVNLLSGNTVDVHSGTQVNTFSGRTFLNSGFHQAVILADFTQFSGVVCSGLSGRSILTGLRKLTNKWDVTAFSGYLTSYQEDDALVSMQQAITATSGASPVTSLDTK